MKEQRPFLLQLFAEEGTGGDSFDTGDAGVDAADTGDTGSDTTDGADGEQTGNGGPDKTPEKQLTQAEVDRIIQDRLARAERKWREKDPANQFFKKTGVDPQLAMQAWEAQQQQRLQEQGYDPVMAQQIAHQQAITLQTQQGLASVRMDVEEARLLPDLEKHGLAQDFEEVRDEAKDLASRSGLSLREAYFALRGPEALSRVSTNAEQRALARAKERQTKGVDSVEGGGELERLGLSREEIAAAQRLGMDPKRAAVLLQVKNLDDFRKLKKG